MRQSLLLFISFGIMFETTSCRKIAFTDCGNGEVHSVDIEPCDKEPCLFKKGTTVTVIAEGTASKGAEGGEVLVTVDLGGVEVPYPGIEPDICKYVQCPVKQGNDYRIVYKLLVEDYFPEVSRSPKKALYFSHDVHNLSIIDRDTVESQSCWIKRSWTTILCICNNWYHRRLGFISDSQKPIDNEPLYELKCKVCRQHPGEEMI